MSGTVDPTYSNVTAPLTWTPVIGQTYSAHFECSDTHLAYQGDITLKAVTFGGSPTLTPTASEPSSDWCVQFISATSTVEFSSGWLYGGETISLTIFG